MAIFGVGTEVIEVVRIANMITAHGEQFLERVYTANEIEYCLCNANTNHHFAKRWAAKEASMKALRCRNQGVRWTDLEVLVHSGDGPTISLSGAAAIWADQIGVTKLHLSMAASRTNATAYVIATDEMD